MRNKPTTLGEVSERKGGRTGVGLVLWGGLLALMPCHSLPPVLGSPLAKCLFLFHSSQMLQLTQSPFNYLFTQTQEDSKLREGMQRLLLQWCWDKGTSDQ